MSKLAAKKKQPTASKRTKATPKRMKAVKKKITKKADAGIKISIMVGILRTLKRTPEISAPQIAKKLKRNVPLIYAGVADLEKKHLIASKLDESGGRGRKGNVLFLTAAGKKEIGIIG